MSDVDHEHAMMMDVSDDPHGHDEFEDGRAPNTAAGEAIIAKHLEAKSRRAAELNARYLSEGKASFLSRAWWANAMPAPWNHIKNNTLTIATTTLAGAGLATVGTIVLSNTTGITPDAVSVLKTSVLSYPAWRLLNDGGARVGFYIGHFMNAVGRDRFHEVKTEPAGRWTGRIAAIGMALAGGIYGHAYVNAAINMTVQLPHTVLQGVPSFVADTLGQANTSIDMIWEVTDQPKCELKAQFDLNHICRETAHSAAAMQVLNGEIDASDYKGPMEQSYWEEYTAGATSDISDLWSSSAAEALWQNGIPTRNEVNEAVAKFLGYQNEPVVQKPQVPAQ